MKVKVKKIDGTKDVEINGKNLPVTKFITEDDQIVETFARVEEGQEYEGEITEDKYGKKFKKATSGFSGFKNGGISKEESMKIIKQHSQDMALKTFALQIKLGKIKEFTTEQVIAVASLYTLDVKSGAPKIKEKAVEVGKNVKESPVAESMKEGIKEAKGDEVDIDDLPF